MTKEWGKVKRPASRLRTVFCGAEKVAVDSRDLLMDGYSMGQRYLGGG